MVSVIAILFSEVESSAGLCSVVVLVIGLVSHSGGFPVLQPHLGDVLVTCDVITTALFHL